MEKKLKDLLEGVEVEDIFTTKDAKITGIFDDSRKVIKNGLFVAVKGLTVDGHEYIDTVIEKGAVVVVGEIEPKKDWLDRTIYIKTKNSRKALGMIASNWFDNPSRKLHLVGVTGTDGKTTTASMIYHILQNSGKKVGLLTTVSAKIENEEIDTGFHVTSPDSIELQRLLKKMFDKGLNYAVIEVTSHGLAQERVAGTNFETAVMTNITHEHLDYHNTKKDYFESKLKLFLMAKNFVILNYDDSSARLIEKKLDKDIDLISYGTRGKAEVEGQDYRKKGKYYEFNLVYGDKSTEIKLRMPGIFNMENAMAAISTGIAYGVSPDKVSNYFLSFTGVKGRMHEIKNKKGLKIYVDFAHTPNSLERALKFLKSQKRGKLIVVFGCAGERDVKKRTLMPVISIKNADISVFTAEDPRSENVEDILKTMKRAAKKVGGKAKQLKSYSSRVYGNRANGNIFFSIPERGEAITSAINKIANSGDTIAILGKGHERSMAYNGREYPWSDFDAVKFALKGEVKKIKRT